MIVKKTFFSLLVLLFFPMPTRSMLTVKQGAKRKFIPQAARQLLSPVARQFHIYDKESDYNVTVDESVINLVPVVKQLLQTEKSSSIGLKDDYANGTVEALFNILILPPSDREAGIKHLSFAELLPVAAYAHSLQIAPGVGKIFNAEIKFKLANVYEGKMRLTGDDYAVLNNMVGDLKHTIISDKEWLFLIDNFTIAIMRKNYNKNNIRFRNIGNPDDKGKLNAIDKVVFSPTNDRIVCMVQEGESKLYAPCIVYWTTARSRHCSTKAKTLDVAFTTNGSRMIYISCEYEAWRGYQYYLVFVDMFGNELKKPINLPGITQGLYNFQNDALTDRLAINSDSECAFGIESRDSNNDLKSNILLIDIAKFFKEKLTEEPLTSIYEDHGLFPIWLRFNPKDESLLYLYSWKHPSNLAGSGFDTTLCVISKDDHYSKGPSLSKSPQRIFDIYGVRDGLSVALSKYGEMMAFIKVDDAIEIRQFDKPDVIQNAWYHPNQSNISFEKPVKAIDFSRDGRLLIGGTWLGDIVVWSTATGKQVGSFKALSQNLSISVSADGKKMVVGGSGYNEKAFANLFMWDYMSDNDLAALEKIKDTDQFTPAQMVLLKLIYGAYQNDESNEILLTEADQSVFASMPKEIQIMLHDKKFIRSKFEPIIEGPFKEEKASHMFVEQTEKALQNVPYEVRKEVAKKSYLQKLLDLINYYRGM